jgi:hypothetical protein
MTVMDENDEINTSTFTSDLLIAFLDVHTRYNNISPLHILCMLMSHKIPLLTFTLVRTWYEESTSWDDLIPLLTE